MYGFGLIRELELHQEAGFHPIKVIQHATGNNAKILGQEDKLGRVRAGYLADLIVVNGNPLENLKVLYPGGVGEIKDGKVVQTGGVEWTIKDGIPYHGPTLMREVKELVTRAQGRTNGESRTVGRDCGLRIADLFSDFGFTDLERRFSNRQISNPQIRNPKIDPQSAISSSARREI